MMLPIFNFYAEVMRNSNNCKERNVHDFKENHQQLYCLNNLSIISNYRYENRTKLPFINNKHSVPTKLYIELNLVQLLYTQ